MNTVQIASVLHWRQVSVEWQGQILNKLVFQFGHVLAIQFNCFEL